MSDEPRKEKKYDFMFRNRKNGAILKIRTKTTPEVVVILAECVNTVADWDMNKRKCKQ